MEYPLETLEHSFCGYKMQQHIQALPIFSHFFHHEKFSRIIELGTGYGGFSIFLACVAEIMNVDFVTYDLKCKLNDRKKNVLDRLNAWRINCNIFEDKYIKEIECLIKQKGRVLLLCDNGKKIEEFRIFAKVLKPNDVIMCHDYWRTNKDYDRPWFKGREVTYMGVKQACEDNNLIDFYRKEFEYVCWGSFIKE